MTKKKLEENNDQNEKIIALHEAAHGGISYLYGHKFDFLTIIPNLKIGYKGVLKRSPIQMANEAEGMSDSEFKNYLKEEIIILLSGGAATYALTSDQQLLGDIQEDGEKANNLAKMIIKPETDTNQILTELAAFAGRLVHESRNWKAINNLAIELLKKKTVTYAEVKMVIDKTFVN
jgi:hypothetical protein